jgi:hypothetical protein
MSVARARRRPLLVLAVAACMAAGLSGPLVTGAAAASPAPVKVVVESAYSGVAAPDGTPPGAIPNMIVKKDQQFSIDVHFEDSSGARAAFTKDTTLAISANRGGIASPSTGLAPKGLTDVTLVTSLPEAANQVVVTVAVAGGKEARTVAAGVLPTAQAFDVLKQYRFENSPAETLLQAGIGGTDDCTEATRTDAVCGILILPSGANDNPTVPDNDVLLSVGACDPDYANCDSRGSVVQVLANLDGLYTKTSPATLLVKCDKVICGNGGIQSHTLNVNLNADEPIFTPAEPCQAKGTIGDNQDFCVDYVQSKRDGSGDSIFYLLLTRDVRVWGG